MKTYKHTEYLVTYRPSEFAHIIGVCLNTVQRWDNEKKLIAHRTKGGRRFYTQEQIDAYFKENNIKQITDDDNA